MGSVTWDQPEANNTPPINNRMRHIVSHVTIRDWLSDIITDLTDINTELSDIISDLADIIPLHR